MKEVYQEEIQRLVDKRKEFTFVRDFIDIFNYLKEHIMVKGTRGKPIFVSHVDETF